MLPKIMIDCLEYLKDNSFILRNQTVKSEELRNIAVEYAEGIKKDNNKIMTVVLTGSSVGGYSGEGSDIDVDVLIDGETRPISKIIYKNVPIDLQYKSYSEWKDDCINLGESIKYLTHSVPIIDNTGEFKKLQRELLSQYYSPESIKKHYEIVSEVVKERGGGGVINAENGYFVPAAIKIHSVLYEVISFLIYRYKGIACTSLMLSEFERISRELNHPEWFSKAIKYMRFSITKETAMEYLKDYEKLFIEMRKMLSENQYILKRLKSIDAEYFGGCCQIDELCSETNFMQLKDKINRCIGKNKMYDAGLNFWFETHSDFMMFVPFFYLKNVNRDAAGKEITSKSFKELYDCWDENIKVLWEKIYGGDMLTRELLIDMNNLSNEIIAFCRPC